MRMKKVWVETPVFTLTEDNVEVVQVSPNYVVVLHNTIPFKVTRSRAGKVYASFGSDDLFLVKSTNIPI